MLSDAASEILNVGKGVVEGPAGEAGVKIEGAVEVRIKVEMQKIAATDIGGARGAAAGRARDAVKVKAEITLQSEAVQLLHGGRGGDRGIGRSAHGG
jgi:hypothetical protein